MAIWCSENISLVGKWIWRFPLDSNSLWHKIIKSKFRLQQIGGDVKRQYICYTSKSLEVYIRYRIYSFPWFVIRWEMVNVFAFGMIVRLGEDFFFLLSSQIVSPLLPS